MSEWNPWDWAKGALGWVVRGVDDVKNFVVSVVTDAVNLVENDAIGLFNDAVNFGHRILDWAGSEISKGLDWAGREIGKVYDWTSHEIGKGLDWAGREIGKVYDWASREIGKGLDWVGHELASVYNWTSDEIGKGLNWAGREIGKVYDWASHEIAAAWDAAYRDVIHPILQVLDDAWHKIDTLWQWYWRVFIDEWHIVEKALGWIVWLAEHPIEAFPDLERMLLSLVKGEGLGPISDYASSFLGQHESTLAEVLGV